MVDTKQVARDILAEAILKRTYSRPTDNYERENWKDICDRVIPFLVEEGKLNQGEANLVDDHTRDLISTPAGRLLWVGGTEWSKKNQNSPGLFNCNGTHIESWSDFEQNFDLLMQGAGVGSVSTINNIEKLPTIKNRLKLEIVGVPGQVPEQQRKEHTEYQYDEDERELYMIIGDSRQGWSSSIRFLLEAASSDRDIKKVTIDKSHVRPQGERLKGFGGTANPSGLDRLYETTVKITNKAVNRKLKPVEAEILLCEAGVATVAGNVRRSARLGLFSAQDKEGEQAKTNLFQVDEEGNWTVDLERDAFRMANFTRAFHSTPSKEEIEKSVSTQFQTSEGAIMNVREAVARANADLLDTPEKKQQFLSEYKVSPDHAAAYLKELMGNGTHPSFSVEEELHHRMRRFSENPCSEIIGSDFFCNLSLVHLSKLDPDDWMGQLEAFEAATIQVLTLLHREFVPKKYKESRALDPIIAVNFTGGFNFFTQRFGTIWLLWWQQDRDRAFDSKDIPLNNTTSREEKALRDLYFSLYPDADPDFTIGEALASIEQYYFKFWNDVVNKTVDHYCKKHELRRPNRVTALQPGGTKSLLTGDAPGWHPPFSAAYIRRVQFQREHPIALAALDIGLTVIPSVDAKDENGGLLDDIWDERVTDWLVEFPIIAPQGEVFEEADFDPSKISAIAQFDFAMMVQNYFCEHNTSSTIMMNQEDIQPLSDRIYEAIKNDEGYISFALQQRFDAMPRMPFEPRPLEEVEQKQKGLDYKKFAEKMQHYFQQQKFGDSEGTQFFCSSGKCEL